MRTAVKSEKLSIKFGGLWQEFHENIINSEDKRVEAEKQLAVVERERDNLRSDLTILSEKFEAIVGSLTDASTSHMDQKQIINTIREEKEELKDRCMSLETQRDWLEKGNKALKAQIEEQTSAAEISDQTKSKLEKALGDREKDIQILKHKLTKNEDIVQQLRLYVEKNKQDAIVFHKAVIGKDKQMQTILRERNRLRDELEKANKALKNPTNVNKEEKNQKKEETREDDKRRERVEVSNGAPSRAGTACNQHHDADNNVLDGTLDSEQEEQQKQKQIDDLMREYGNPWSGGSDTEQKMAVKTITSSASSPLRNGREQPTHAEDVLLAMGRIRRPRSVVATAGTGMSKEQQQNGAVAEVVLSAAKDRERVYQDAIKRLKIELASARSGLAVAIGKNKKLQSDMAQVMQHHHHQQQTSNESTNHVSQHCLGRDESPSAGDIVSTQYGPLPSTPTPARTKAVPPSAPFSSPSSSSSRPFSAGGKVGVSKGVGEVPMPPSPATVMEVGTSPPPAAVKPVRARSASCDRRTARLLQKTSPSAADANTAATAKSSGSNSCCNSNIKSKVRPTNKQHTKFKTGASNQSKSVSYKTPADSVPSDTALANDNPFRVNYYNNPW